MSQQTPNEARIESHMAPFTQSETLMKQCFLSLIHYLMHPYVCQQSALYTLCHVAQILKEEKKCLNSILVLGTKPYQEK